MKFLVSIFIVQGLSVLLGFMKLISKQSMVNVLRFTYGTFLIFSGFVKILDPLGFSYKLQEYFEVFGMEWLISFSLLLAVFICVFEIFIGLFLLCGIHVKRTLYSNLALMIGFTFLTFYSAYFNVVTDCGCFGDFMKLEPWFSFQKDIILLIVSMVLFRYQVRIDPIFNQKTTNHLVLTSFVVILFVPIYGLSHLPIVDFRDYKIGASIVEGRKLPDDAKKDIYEDVWYYEIQGEIQEFTTSQKPWDIEGAVFKDRVSKLISKGDEPLIHDFDIINEMIGMDVTDSLLSMERIILVICYDIEKTNLDGHDQIDVFITNSMASNIPVYGLSSSSYDDVKTKLMTKNLNYPYFLVDQTTLKTVIRANPGVLLIEDGVVVDKWHWRDVPEYVSDKID